MMKMTNAWNRIIYALWAPVYDQTVNRIFAPGRKRALEILNLQPGERVLIVGVGTGEDLLLLPAGVESIGTDLSPAMLAKARAKLKDCRAEMTLVQADAQLPLDGPLLFDAAILNLILSVIPDANACLRATLGALRPGARAVIFDKFLSDGQSPSPLRRLTNVFSMIFGTDINRQLSEVLRDCPCELLCNEPSIGRGLYRVILLRKTPEERHRNAADISA